MRPVTSLRSVSAMALGVALVWGLPAGAQTAAGSTDQSGAPTTSATSSGTSDTQVADIVVTAQRRAESLSRVGISVTAVGSEELSNRKIEDPGDLTKVVPGLTATTSYGGAPVYTLRGIGFNTPNATATSPVGIYMDEAAVPYPYMSLGLVYDLERVEVLKGPQGTLYGRNATGGLVNYVVAKPTDTFQGGVQLEAGSYDTVNATGFVSGPVNDMIRFRFAFDSLNRGAGYQYSVTTGEKLGVLYQKSLRSTIDIGDGGPFSATLTGNYWKRDGDTLGTQAIYAISLASPTYAPFFPALGRASLQPNPTSDKAVDFYSYGRQTQAGTGIYHPSPLTNSQFYSGTAKLSYTFSPTIRLQSLTSYDNLRQRDASDAGGTATDTLFIDSTSRINSISQELRLIGESARLNWSLGGYYAHDNAHERDFAYNNENAVIGYFRATAIFLNAMKGPAAPYTAAQIATSFGNFRDVTDTSTDVYAGFANADYKFSDLLKLTVGGRYTKDKTDFTGCTYDTNGGSLAFINTVYPLFGIKTPLGPNGCYTLQSNLSGFVPGPVHSNIDQNNFAFRANLDITPSSTTLFYGSISRGYKSGGFPTLAASNASQFNPVAQEKLTAYEIGTKLGLFDRRVQLNLAGFYYDYTNKQVYGRVQDLIFVTLTRIQNVPRSREIGVEGDVTWRVTPTLTAHGAATYLDSKILQFTTYDDFSVLTDERGKTFAYTPKFSGNGGLSYDGPMSDTLHFIADADVSFQGRSHADASDRAQFNIAGYALVDGSIGIKAADDRWRIQAFATNLLDKYYWTGVAAGTDTVFRYPGMPRQLGVRGAYKFR